LKVVAENGWFAARPSGTEDIYKPVHAHPSPGRNALRRVDAQFTRVGEWRRIMARRLILGGLEEQKDVQPVAACVPLKT
jgi:hypothetical protein